jgi:hypothetical protein
MVTDPKLAAEIVAVARDCNRQLNEVLFRAQRECSESEFLAIRDHVGFAIGALFTEVMRPIYIKHPSLAPEELRESLPAPDA